MVNSNTNNTNESEEQRYDVEEKINKYMHHIEKGVSKTLENILAEIMTHKGKKVSLHFKSKRRTGRNYETSPESSETQFRFASEDLTLANQ